jgi:uncharacterized protein (DUF2384 family)
MYEEAADEQVEGIDSNVGLVLAQLDGWLPQTSQREVARLVGVGRQTLGRWSTLAEPPQRRLALVARLVAILRHSWTEEGVIAWFERPNRDLDQAKPLEVLNDAAYEHALLLAAHATRTHYAT